MSGGEQLFFFPQSGSSPGNQLGVPLMVRTAVWSKSGVTVLFELASVLRETRETRINIGEEDGRHEGTRTPDLYRVKVAL